MRLCCRRMSHRYLLRGAWLPIPRLRHAQGFVRVAVQTGASLVPVLSFGENDLFTTYRPDKASRLAKVQRCATAQILYINLGRAWPCAAPAPQASRPRGACMSTVPVHGVRSKPRP